MRAVRTALYAAFLRFLAGCYPLVWDLKSLSAARDAIDRRHGGRI